MNISLQSRNLQAFILMLAVLLVSTSAFAQKPYTFSPSGSVIMRTGGGNPVMQYVSIKNETNANLKLHITYAGDTNIKFGYAPYENFTLGPDSGASFPMYYRGWAGDTSRGFLRIYDSVYAPDTIRYTGIDTGTVANPWDVSSNRNSWAGDYYSRPDTAWIPIVNNQNDSLYVSASIVGGSYGFVGIAPQGKTIAANSTATFAYYFNSGSYVTAEAVVMFSGGGVTDTAKIHGRKISSNNFDDTLSAQSYLSFGSIPAGDTLCKTLTIYNHEDTAAALTSLNMLQNSGYYFSDLPALPLTIDANDSLSITVCFVAPDESGANSNSYMNIYYSFGNSQKGLTVYLYGSSTSCFSASTDFINFGMVPRDQSETRSFYLFNNRDVSTSVDLSLNPNNSAFTILTSSPVSIAANDTAEIEVRYTASGSGAVKLVMDGIDSCGQLEIALIGYIDDSTVMIDSNSIALFGDDEFMLNFEGDSTDLLERYVFYNDQSDSITVTSIYLRQGIHFSINEVEPQYPEFKLGPGDAFAVTIEFDGDPGSYNDTLMIVTETGVVALSFPMHAVIHGTADVATSAFAAPRVMVTPNPSSGPVTISITDANTASIEVLDIMGKRVARFDGGSATLARNDLSAGTYFVRASGVGLDRKPFVMTTRIVIK